MESQWVSDIKSFTPNAPPIMSYIVSSAVLVVISSGLLTKCCLPSGAGLTVTNQRTGEVTQNKWLPWVFFFLGVLIVPFIIVQSLYKLHFMILNPKFTGTVVGTSMIRNALR